MEHKLVCGRRAALKAAGAGLAAALAAPHVAGGDAPKAKGRVKQSVCRWCYGRIPLAELAEGVKRIGYRSVELLTPEEFKVVKPLGLTCAILGGADIANGLNRRENHGWIEKHLREYVEFAAAEGIPNVICMAGNRKGMGDDEGMGNCAAGLKRVLGFAEEKQVTLCMEGLNSKVDHKDYMYDRTEWGVALCRAVGSPRFKLLYDIYHMQIMEGDVIRTVRKHKEHIAHYHTGGVPGRHEIDQTQELNYPAILQAVADAGFDGYVAQEFIPKREPFRSLAEAFALCDV
jgi:hydroxypyruvate isomerase